MDTRLLIAVFLLIDSTIGCSGSESGSPFGAGTSNSGVNGIHAGEIWIADSTGSERFNLQTGKSVKVSDDIALPSTDGSVYVEYIDSDGSLPRENCAFSDWITARTINIKNSRNAEKMSSFQLRVDVNLPLRLSPDGQRMALYAAEDEMDCGDNNSNHRVAVYSTTGELLYRDFDGLVKVFDWHPDGRLIIMHAVPGTENGFQFKIESTPGSYKFIDDNMFAFIAPPGVIYYTGFRVNPVTGNDAVIEAVYDTPIWNSGIQSRDSKVHHFPLSAALPETNLFDHGDDTPRVNGPTFSPDGQHILVTEGFSSGSLTTEIGTQIGANEVLLDLPLWIPLPAGSQASYIVPIETRLQPMPPANYSETIRPVLKRSNDGNDAVAFNPLTNLTWTPVIE